jgi:hypothetical protein
MNWWRLVYKFSVHTIIDFWSIFVQTCVMLSVMFVVQVICSEKVQVVPQLYKRVVLVQNFTGLDCDIKETSLIFNFNSLD